MDSMFDLGPVFSALAGEAEHLDRGALFPLRALSALRATGTLAAPVPPAYGGPGLGTAARGTAGILALLQDLGRANLSLARVFEAHVNAIRLICRYGASRQIERACEDARQGHLFALWVTDQNSAPVTLKDGLLTGCKGFCSGAGVATRALITAAVSGRGELMAVIDLDRHQIVLGPPFDLHGVRSAATAKVDFTGVPLAPEDLIGAAEDYMRQPEISLGAWRPLGVMLGGMAALVTAFEQALSSRGRDVDPHQRARLGHALIALETATLWVHRCAALTEADDAGEDAANYTKLARIAFERCCLQAIELTQRSIGIATMVRPNPIERLCRDLNTYLRQPAFDMALDEAAAYFIGRPLP